MRSKTKHIRSFTARLWMRQVAMLLFVWFQGFVTVFSKSVLTFLETIANIQNIFDINKLFNFGNAKAGAFPPFTLRDEWVSCANIL
jgi:hypothetical protein